VGQKIHPKGLRLGYIKEWDSKWFNLRQMPDLLEEDRRIRQYLKHKLQGAAVSRIMVERAGKRLRVTIFTARPGIVIGRKGADIDNLRSDISLMTDRKLPDVSLNVMEIKRPELDAQLVSEGIALQLEKNIGFRRVMKKTMERTMAAGALGIKVRVSGRLGGAEIARVEWMKEGRVPLQTFRADIDYGFAEALITMGRIGCKVWIFKKELFKKTREDLIEEVKLIPKEELEQLAKTAVLSPPAGEEAAVADVPAEANTEEETLPEEGV
jgi:small subunit ribosomal protein S3